MSTIHRAMERMRAQGKLRVEKDGAIGMGVEPGLQGDVDARQVSRDLYPGDGAVSGWGRLEVHEQIMLRPWAANHGMDLGSTEDRSIVECYRHIKRPLIMNIEGDGRLQVPHANRLMVTSALPNEGKTFTALNLAIMFSAERTKRVIFIDTDLVRSGLPDVVEVEHERGLVDYLENEDCTIEEVILGTDYGNLLVIPAGRSHTYSTEMLASRRMRSLFGVLEDLISEDVVIVLDSPPLLAASDAATLARFVGQVVVVVEASNTTRNDLREALSMIDQSKVAGFILNKDDPLRHRGPDYFRYSA